MFCVWHDITKYRCGETPPPLSPQASLASVPRTHCNIKYERLQLIPSTSIGEARGSEMLRSQFC